MALQPNARSAETRGVAFRLHDKPADADARRRLKVFSPIAFRCQDQEGFGQLHDISPTGCLIEFVFPVLHPEQRLAITLLAQLDELIVLDGVVTGVEGDFAEVEFEALAPETFERLASLLEE